MAAPASASPSAANSPDLLGGEIQLAARPASAAPSSSICRSICRLDAHGAQRARGPAGTACARQADPAAGTAVEDDSGRPPRITAGRFDPADRRGRSALRAAFWSISRTTRGSRCWWPTRGAQALELAKQYQPTAVSLDVFLPDMLGWSVLSQLKQNPLTRHIPVQIIPGRGPPARACARRILLRHQADNQGRRRCGAGRIKEYAGRARKRLLVVEDNAAEQMSIGELLGHDDIEIVDGGKRQRSARYPSQRGRSIAWCWICACPTCRASTCLRNCAQESALAEVPVVVFTGRATDARGGCAASHHGAQHRRQGRGIAGTPAG